MPTLFSKPIDEINHDDVLDLIGWPEGLAVEYKKELPGRDGRPDLWMTGEDRFEAYARNKIFKEIVALANTVGGHVILGMDETDDIPATAMAINPIPRCADLAERFDRAVQQLDPPIRLLQIKAVQTDDDGSGVVIFRVPQSPSAPHRSPDKDCYVRNGANSVPISMREIQDLTMARLRTDDGVQEQFRLAEQRFADWVTRIPFNQSEIWTALSIVAVPAIGDLELPRIQDQPTLPRTLRALPLKVNGHNCEGYPLHFPQQSRPIVRGRRWTAYRDDPERSYVEQHRNGMISAGFRHVYSEAIMHPSWILGYLCNIIGVVDWTREQAQAPEAEYLVKVSVNSYPIVAQTRLASFSRNSWGDIGVFQEFPISLPILSYGSESSKWQLVNELIEDLVDATGANEKFCVGPAS